MTRTALLYAALLLGCGAPNCPPGYHLNATMDLCVALDGGLDLGAIGDMAVDLTNDAPCAAPDGDGDGHASTSCGGDDCDDAHSAAHPGLAEICDGLDNDCDGVTDGTPATTWCNDGARGLHATAACASGACAVISCTAPFLDCSLVEGCETDGSSTSASCGTCTHACFHPACSGGECARDMIGVAAGFDHTCAVRTNGTVACWGSNMRGQLGDGTTTNHITPAPVIAIVDAISVAAGGSSFGFASHSCLVRSGGHVACWGDNRLGQLGDGTTMQRSTPVDVLTINDAVQVAAGDNRTCARRASGAVACWGASMDGTSSPVTVPIDVPTIADAIDVAVGWGFACAVRSGGGVVCWGSNAAGQLGDRTTISRPAPVAAGGVGDAVQVIAGAVHTCARRSGGGVVCWGGNSFGQLGGGSTAATVDPVTVGGLTDAMELASGYGHTCARRMDGSVVCWGTGTMGQLGDGAAADESAPVAVSGLTDALALGHAEGHTCAIRQTGAIVCWGYNGDGELGDGTTADAHTPVTVMDP